MSNHHHLNKENQNKTCNSLLEQNEISNARNDSLGITEILHKCGVGDRQTTFDRKNMSNCKHICSLSQHSLVSENGSLAEHVQQFENSVEERHPIEQSRELAQNVSLEMSSVELCLDNIWTEIKKCTLVEIKELLQKMDHKLQKEIHAVKKRYETDFNKCLSEQSHLQNLLLEKENEKRRTEAVVENLLQVLKQQKERHALKDVLIQWHKNTLKRKFENAQLKIAQTHSERHMKQKAFHAWTKMLKEKRHTTNQHYLTKYNNQQLVIRQQQQKIEELTAELERTKSKLNFIKGKTSEQQEIMRRSLLRGVCALNMETMNLFSSTDLAKYLSSKNSPDPTVEDRFETKNLSSDMKSGGSASSLLEDQASINSPEDDNQRLPVIGPQKEKNKTTKSSTQKETGPKINSSKKIRVHNYYCERFHK